MGESNAVVSAYTLYRHLQQYCSHPSISSVNEYNSFLFFCTGFCRKWCITRSWWRGGILWCFHAWPPYRALPQRDPYSCPNKRPFCSSKSKPFSVFTEFHPISKEDGLLWFFFYRFEINLRIQ